MKRIAIVFVALTLATAIGTSITLCVCSKMYSSENSFAVAALVASVHFCWCAFNSLILGETIFEDVVKSIVIALAAGMASIWFPLLSPLVISTLLSGIVVNQVLQYLLAEQIPPK